MNSSGAFVMALTLFGWVSPGKASSLLRRGKHQACIAFGSDYDFEAILNPQGTIELQGLLPLSNGAEKKRPVGLLATPTAATPEGQIYRGREARDFVTVEAGATCQAGSVTGQGVRGSGAILAGPTVRDFCGEGASGSAQIARNGAIEGSRDEDEGNSVLFPDL